MKRSLLVILVTFNNKEVIKNCLNSIIKQIFSDFKLLIIDNNSSDKTNEVIKSYLLDNQKLKDKTEILKNSQNIGFSRAVNIGLNKALKKEDYYKAVLLINPDTYFDKYFFKNGIDTLFLEKDIGACCPKILYPDGGIWWIGSRHLSTKEIILGLNYGISKHINKGEKDSFEKGVFQLDLLTGCALFIKTETIKKVGLFDENYFMYVEDVDYSLRLKGVGYKLILFNKGEVYHVQKEKKENILPLLRRHVVCIKSIGIYVLRNYPICIFTAWLIKLPFVLGFKFIRKIIPNKNIWLIGIIYI